MSAVLQDENDMSSSDQMTGHTSGKKSYTLFQGHSGPVHAATFSPIGDFVLSSSADTTSMIILAFLYSLKLGSSFIS